MRSCSNPVMVKSELIVLVQILDGSDIHAAGDRLWNLRVGLLNGEDPEPWRAAASWLHELGVIDDEQLGDCVVFLAECQPSETQVLRSPIDADADDDDEDAGLEDDDDVEFTDWDDEDAVESELGHAALASRVSLPVCGSPEARLHALTPGDQQRFDAGQAFDAQLLVAYARSALPPELAEYVKQRLAYDVAFHEAFHACRRAA